MPTNPASSGPQPTRATDAAAALDKTSRRTLSKSDFTLARTCAAKLHFREHHYPDNRDDNPYLELLKEGGYMVEALAKAQHLDGIQLQFGGDMSVAESYAKTIEYLERENVTLFDATLLHNRRQARVDILIKRGSTVRLLEVKAKSFDGGEHAESLAEGRKGALRGKRPPFKILGEWEEKLEDVAFQTILLEKLRPDLTVRPHLVLVDKSKRSGVDGAPLLFDLVVEERGDATTHVQAGRYSGSPELLAGLDLLAQVDVSEEVDMLRDAIEADAERFESLLDAPLDAYRESAQLGGHCAKCEFRVPEDIQPNGFIDCWGPLAKPKPHVLDLIFAGQARMPDRKTKLVEHMVASGTTSLHDVPLDCFQLDPTKPGAHGNRQRRQVEHTRAGSIYCGDELRDELAKLEALSRAGDKLYFVDFETSRIALPYHKGMRPYGEIAFQWSCHMVDALGGAAPPRHSEFLNADDLWPNETFARTLRGAIGDAGPVLTWSHHEATTLRHIAADLREFGREAPDLVDWMVDVAERRIIDLHEWARRSYYYNPRMGGRTSIKVVLDALWQTDAEMRAQFAAWTGRSSEGVEDPYHTLPKLEIAGVLQDVHEGTGAMLAYQEMMYGRGKHAPEVREAWGRLLRQYCELDSLSMVLVVEHWRRVVAG